MMNAREGEFDDPSLRAAVRRAVAGQPAAAPPSLRLRVEQLFETAAPIAIAEGARAAAGGRWPRWAGESRAKTFAAAAAALIAVVIAGLQIWAYVGPGDSAPALRPVVFPVSVAAEMIAAHDNCAKLP